MITFTTLSTYTLIILLIISIRSGNAIKNQTNVIAPLQGLVVSSHDINVMINHTESFSIFAENTFNENITLKFVKQHENLIEIVPARITFLSNNTINSTIIVKGLRAGHLEVTSETQPNKTWLYENVFLRITVAHSHRITYISFIFGWLYFLAWSISFYPQIWYNFRQKSVIGLNFDFLLLNFMGFALYSVFNLGLYYDTVIQSEYANRYPRGVIPVLLNDVGFSLHALAATTFTIVQCFIYERGNQRISITSTILFIIFSIVVLISAGLAGYNILHWLDVLYICSYIKLCITIIKYIPQALMNYRRKSTIGWSIGNILLDFTGGILSMLQMILNAYNYDDWLSIFGDPTKFGLGLFSVLFDIFFILQHYVFYRNSNKRTKPSEPALPSPNSYTTINN